MSRPVTSRRVLPALPISELRAGLANLPGQLADAAARKSRRAELLRIHDLLMQGTATTEAAPTTLLAHVASSVASYPPAVEDGLQPRPRTVFRLLRAEAYAAAWKVLADNAAGVVEEPSGGTTSSGASAARPRLPLTTHVDDGSVFAWLPGFRDPRYAAADACYDISPLVVLSASVEEIWLDGGALFLSGSASLSQLEPSRQESVSVACVASDGRPLVTVVAERHTRPDLVTGSGEAARRLLWAGWSVVLDLGVPPMTSGECELLLSLDHDGVQRHTILGSNTGHLARRALPLEHHSRQAMTTVSVVADALKVRTSQASRWWRPAHH